MALLDFGSQGGQQSGGMLGDLDPTSRFLVGMSLLNKFTGKNRGSESGFGDIFGIMMQQQQLKRQAQADALNRERFGLEQKEFALREKQYGEVSAEAARKAQMDAAKQAELDRTAESIMGYKAPTAEMKPVVEEYSQMPVGDASVNVPTESYINNLFSASDEARKTPTKGAFVTDPAIREQAAAMIKTGDPALAKQAYELLQQGGAFTLAPGATRYTGTGDVVASSSKADSQNLPAGYQWVDFNDTTKGLAPIPGGPAEKMSPDQAGRAQLPESALSAAKTAQSIIYDSNTGKFNRGAVLQMYTNLPGTEGARARANMEDAVANALYLKTGAAATKEEVAKQSSIYLPRPWDSDKTKLDKMQRFNDFVGGVSSKVGKARGGQQVPVSQDIGRSQSSTPTDTGYSQEDLEFTAQKYGMTIDQVKAKLGAK
jgi:hypothetical protein